MEREIAYRKALPTDALLLSILFQQVYISTYAFDGITREYANFITKRFAPGYIENTINTSPDSLIVATCLGNPVGVAEINFTRPCPIGNITAPELSKLYVLERFCGMGIGYNLMQKVEQTCAAKGHKQLWLEVWDLNPHAIAFYGRLGYKTIGMVDFPMEDNTYDNRVMIKDLQVVL